MPFFKVTPHALLIEAAVAQQAAMNAYRAFEDRTPNQFEVLGPESATLVLGHAFLHSCAVICSTENKEQIIAIPNSNSQQIDKS